MDYKKLTGDILADSKENSKRIESNLSYAKYLASKSAYDKDVSEMYGVLRNSERKKMKNIENSANLQSALASISDKTDIVESSLLMQYITSSVDFDFSMTETSYILKGSLALKNELAGVSWRGKVLGANIEIELTDEATEDAEGISVNNKSFRVTKICNSKTAIDEVTLEFDFEISQDEISNADVILKIIPFIEEDETIYFFDEVKEINLKETVALKYYNDKNAPLPNLSDWEVRDATEEEIEEALTISEYEYYDGYIGKSVKMLSYVGSGGAVSMPIEPKGIAYIYYKVFPTSKNVTAVYVPEGTEYIPNNCFGTPFDRPGSASANTTIEKISLPSSLKCIGGSAFPALKSLGVINIPDNVETIGEYAFSNCTSLATVSFGENLKKLHRFCFSNNVVLNNVSLPDGLLDIEDSAFIGCSSLSNINIPKTLRHMGSTILDDTEYFENKDNWDSVAENVGVLYIGNYLISVKEKSVEEFVEEHMVLVIKDGTTLIADRAFSSFYFDNIVLPSSMRYIGNYAFDDVPVLNVDFNDGLLSIGYYAFRDSDIRSATIPNSVNHIGVGAFATREIESFIFGNGLSCVPKEIFYNAQSLSSLTIPEGITTIESNAFKESGIETLFLPSSLVKIGPNVFPFSEGDFPEGLTIIYNGSLTEWQAISVDEDNDGLTNGDIRIVTNTGELPENSSVRYTYNYDAKTAIIEPIEGSGTLSMLAFISSQYSIKALNPATLYVKGFSGIEIEEGSLDGCTNLNYIILQDISAITSISIPENVSIFYDGAMSDIPTEYREIVKPLRGTLSGDNYNINYDYSPFDNSVILSKGEGSDSRLYRIDEDDLPCSEVEIIKIRQGIEDIEGTPFDEFDKFKDNNMEERRELILPNSMYDNVLQGKASMPALCSALFGNGARTDDNIIGYYDNHGEITQGQVSYLSSIIDRVVNGISWQYDFRNSSLKIGADIIYTSEELEADKTKLDTTTRFGEELNIARRKIFADEDGIKTVEMSDSITSIRASAFAKMEDLVSVHLPDYTGSKTGLFEIPELCFDGCINLETVNIPRNVTVIRHGAFRYCKKLCFRTPQNEPNPNFIYRDENGYGNLREIELGAFRGCHNIEAISLPEGLSTMGHGAFSMFFNGLTMYNSECKSLSIPSTLKNIPEHAFEQFARLENLEIRNGVRTIGACAFQSMSSELSEDVSVSIVIPDSVTEIGSGAFEGALRISDVKMSANIKEIGDEVFYNCKSLKNFYADSSNAERGLCLDGVIETVGESAFEDCVAVSSITIGNNVRVLSELCFHGIKEISSLVIPNNVQEIGSGIISPDTKLTSITIPFLGLDCENSAKKTFSYLADEDASFLTNTYLKHIIITPPANKTLHIPANAFSGFEEVTSITLNSGGAYGTITEVGEGAFSGCSSLTSLTVPTTVTKMGLSSDAGVEGATGLEEVVGIVNGCTSLETLSVPFIGNARHTDSSMEPATQKITYFFYGMDEQGNAIDGTIADMNEDYTAFKNLTTYEYIPNKACCESYEESLDGETYTYYDGLNIESLSIYHYSNETLIQICDNAFRNCRRLSSLTIANGNLFVGEGAFCIDDPDSLEQTQGIHTPDSEDYVINTLNYDCTIQKKAFYGQKYMSQFCKYHNSGRYATIGESAFENCESLLYFAKTQKFSHSLRMSSANKTFYYYAIQAYSFGKFAFKNCKSLQNVEIAFGSSNGDNIIPESCFEGCTSIARVFFPTSTINGYPAKLIGKAAFKNCTSLIEFPIPEKISEIGDSAFEDCSSLHLIEFNNKVDTNFANGYSGVKTIGEKAFKNCRKLCYIIDAGKTVTINNVNFPSMDVSNGYYRDSWIYGYYQYSDYLFSFTSSMSARQIALQENCPMKMTLPLGITKVKKEAFMNCASSPISEIQAVASYADYAFVNSVNKRVNTDNLSQDILKRHRDLWIYIPNTLIAANSIEEGAFSGIKLMTKMRYVCGASSSYQYDGSGYNWEQKYENGTYYYRSISTYFKRYTSGKYNNGLYERKNYRDEWGTTVPNVMCVGYETQFNVISFLASWHDAPDSITFTPHPFEDKGKAYLMPSSIVSADQEVIVFNTDAGGTALIMESAICDCNNLKSVHFGAIALPYNPVFKNCDKITEIEIDLSATRQASANSSTYNAISSGSDICAILESDIRNSLESLILINPMDVDSNEIKVNKFIRDTTATRILVASTDINTGGYNACQCFFENKLLEKDSSHLNYKVTHLTINMYSNNYDRPSSFTNGQIGWRNDWWYCMPAAIPSTIFSTGYANDNGKRFCDYLEEITLGYCKTSGLGASYFCTTNFCRQRISGYYYPSAVNTGDYFNFICGGSESIKKVYLNITYSGAYKSVTNNSACSYVTLSNTIGKNMFNNCQNLEYVYVVNYNYNVNSIAANDPRSYATALFHIGDSAFKDCRSLKCINTSVAGRIATSGTIGENAFVGAFTSDEISNVVMSGYTTLSIGNSAFLNVSKLSGQIILNSSGVNVSIGSYAFSGTNIDGINIDAASIRIGANAFENCTFKNSMVNATSNVYLYTRAGASGDANGIIIIGNSAFKGATFNLPNNATYDVLIVTKGQYQNVQIGESAFEDCKFLTAHSNYSIYIEKYYGTLQIFNNAFKSCSFQSSNTDNTTDSANYLNYNIPIFVYGTYVNASTGTAWPNITFGEQVFDGVVFANKTRALQENGLSGALNSTTHGTEKAVAIWLGGNIAAAADLPNNLFKTCSGNFCVRIRQIQAYTNQTGTAWANLTGYKFKQNGGYSYAGNADVGEKYAGATNPISIYAETVVYDTNNNVSTSYAGRNFFPPLS